MTEKDFSRICERMTKKDIELICDIISDLFTDKISDWYPEFSTDEEDMTLEYRTEEYIGCGEHDIINKHAFISYEDILKEFEKRSKEDDTYGT